MGKGFLDDDDDNWVPSGSSRKPRGGNGGKKQKFNVSLGNLNLNLAWYDYVMIPLLVILAVTIFLNFSDVMKLFLILTIRLIDIGFMLLIILILILILLLLLHRRRY